MSISCLASFPGWRRGVSTCAAFCSEWALWGLESGVEVVEPSLHADELRGGGDFARWRSGLEARVYGASSCGAAEALGVGSRRSGWACYLSPGRGKGKAATARKRKEGGWLIVGCVASLRFNSRGGLQRVGLTGPMAARFRFDAGRAGEPRETASCTDFHRCSSDAEAAGWQSAWSGGRRMKKPRRALGPVGASVEKF